MTLEHNAPDMVCDSCYRRIDTVHNGDEFVADERGWGSNNVVYPIAERIEGDQLESGLAAQQFDHLCPKCLAEHGWTVDPRELGAPEWPFIGCFSFHAPEPDHAD